ncbi:20042_t:CDS:2, partial [Gigaspora margarita]
SQLIEKNDPKSDIKNEFDTLMISEQLRQLLQLPVTNEMLYDLVKAMSYFSLKKYWEVPEKIELVASFLDLRIKNLKFLDNETIKATIFNTVQTLCTEEEYHQPLIRLDEIDDEIYNKTEADRYLRELIEKKDCNPLTWWKDRSEKYLVLSCLAQKYLSVPATLVPSERLFSDAGLHITALHNRLHPDM